MSTYARRSQRHIDIWPGFVDALATLLMVIIFLLMIFVLAQFFLGEAISGRDAALDRLRGQVSELADLLSLERQANTDLRVNVAQISDELQASVTRTEDLAAQFGALTLRTETAEEKAGQLDALTVRFKTAEDKARAAAAIADGIADQLEDTFKTIDADKAKIQLQLKEIATLVNNVAALRALRAELESEVGKLAGSVEEKQTAFLRERSLSESARAQVALLNQQINALRVQLAQIEMVLGVSEEATRRQNIQIANLGNRLNAALASKVQELSRYRSEFFGRLREVLGGQQGIRVVGDRFVFQSELLFTTGSADLGPEGEAQLAQLGVTLKEIAARIPSTIDWILRVDGHTDNVPIHTARFASNWELSTQRAISVVKFLTDQGIPPENLAATGFSEYQPIDLRDDEIARRRNRRIELKLTQR